MHSRWHAGCILSDGLEHDESQTDAAWRETTNQAAPQFRHKDGEPYAYTATGTPEDGEDDDCDQCMAADDDPARIIRDGLPGDALDTELNGDEGDYSWCDE